MAQNYKNNRVIVCGATGFIGSHVVATLIKEGYNDIHIIARGINSTDNLRTILKLYGVEDKLDRLNIHYGSLTNFEWLTKVFEYCHTVFNCAAVVDFIANDHYSLIENNVTLAYLVGEASVKAGVKRIVHVSSVAALEVGKYPDVTTEANVMTTIKGQSPYAISKFYSENEMWRISEKGVDVIVVNPALVMGVGDWKKSTSPQIVETINKGVPFYPKGEMGFVMVEDVAKAMVLLSNCDKAVGERFILCGDNTSYKNGINWIAKGLKRSPAHIAVPNWLLKTAGLYLKMLNKMGVKTKFAPSLMLTITSKHHYDGSKIEQYIPNFKYSNLKEALERTGVVYRKGK